MDVHPPSGTVTFLLTDLEGSTAMWERDAGAMKTAMVRHDELVERAVAANHGFVFSRMGDGMATAFPTARDATIAAAAIQRALTDEPWTTLRPLRARIGLHTADGVLVEGGGYASTPINRCSRLMSAAHGGQIVVSGPTETLVREQLPDDIQLKDLGEHRLRDLRRPTRVFQLDQCDANEHFPPLRSLESYPGNLPAQASSFIGRDLEMSRVAAALETSRVVTITGVGGVGKTRLAIQTAADMLPRYRDGVWLVELAAVRDPAGVREAVLGAFGLANLAGTSLEDALARKELLLLLDNCEHLLGPVSRLVTRIEQTCPSVVVLATSREGMAIAGEQLIALPPLGAGAPGDAIEHLIQTDAVSLFVERARHVKSDFALTENNSAAVSEICQRLDGIPLAIELAAARIIALSPSELVRRLDRRFQMLASGRRGAVERHATLRAAIDWSYDLLTAAEQRLLARLAVFTGGCTLEAIEEVCEGSPVERGEAIDLITSLVSRSLVVADDNGNGTRYRVLETIRQYAEERLAAWNETDAMRERHGRFFGALSARAAEYFYGPDQVFWARRLRFDRGNVRAALTTAIEFENVTLAVQLVADHPFQRNTESPAGEVFDVPASLALKMAGAADQPGYPRALIVAAYKATPDWDGSEELCQQALESERRLASAQQGPSVATDVCHLGAMKALAKGDYVGSVAAFTHAAELAGRDGYPGLAAMYLADAANTGLLGSGEARELVAKAEESVALARRSGMPGAIGLSLNSLALSLAVDDPAKARGLLEESLRLTGTPGEEVPSALLTACLVAGRLRDWPLTLALSARTIYLWRWYMAPMQSGPCLALCARAIADYRPELAGVLQGAGYAAFRHASGRSSSAPPVTPGAASSNFLLAALRETGVIVTTALGAPSARELRKAGEAMSVDDAVSYALANVDPRLLTGPIAVP
jgi:predicted ATPase/class 3 adenylate cyclase